jgi:hypothetical protein
MERLYKLISGFLLAKKENKYKVLDNLIGVCTQSMTYATFTFVLYKSGNVR